MTRESANTPTKTHSTGNSDLAITPPTPLQVRHLTKAHQSWSNGNGFLMDHYSVDSEQRRENLIFPGIAEVTYYGDPNAPLACAILDPHGGTASLNDVLHFFRVEATGYLQACRDDFHTLLKYCLIEGDRGSTPIAHELAKGIGNADITEKKDSVRAVVIRALYPRVIDSNRMFPIKEIIDLEKHWQLVERLIREFHDVYMQITHHFLQEVTENEGLYFNLHMMNPYHPKGHQHGKKEVDFVHMEPGKIEAHEQDYTEKIFWTPKSERTNVVFTIDSHKNHLSHHQLANEIHGRLNSLGIPCTFGSPDNPKGAYWYSAEDMATQLAEQYRRGVFVDFLKSEVSRDHPHHVDFHLHDFVIATEKVRILSDALQKAFFACLAQEDLPVNEDSV